VQEKPDCIVYSFGEFHVTTFSTTKNSDYVGIRIGINYESSFEAEILENTKHCEIWGYDFSVKSFGPEIPKSLTHRTHFKAFGLSGADKHGPDDTPPMYTLETLMKLNGLFLSRQS
jgi:hypothetical protein